VGLVAGPALVELPSPPEPHPLEVDADRELAADGDERDLAGVAEVELEPAVAGQVRLAVLAFSQLNQSRLFL